MLYRQMTLHLMDKVTDQFIILHVKSHHKTQNIHTNITKFQANA
jgi:hypothetical protein